MSDKDFYGKIMRYPNYQTDLTNLGILIGNARTFDNADDFPDEGTLGVRYYDNTTNLYYDWSPLLGEYVLANTNSYSDSSQFPAIGVQGAMYYDEANGLYYEWSNRYNAYILGSSLLFADKTAFPATGVQGVRYLALDTGYYWEWSAIENDYITYFYNQVGLVYSYTGLVAPERHLILDGSAFDTVKYYRLDAWLQANWTGYTSGTLPDMRNKFIRMKNDSRVIGHFQPNAVKQHGHSASGNLTSINLPDFSTATVVGNDNGLYRGNRNFGFQDPTTSGSVSGSVSVSVGNVTGATASTETTVDNIAMNFIICAENFTTAA